MTKQLARARHTDDGYTLIEMIVAIVLTTMILGALATVFVTSARSTSSTKHRSNQSNDAQIISSFLVKDAQAAGGIDPLTGTNDDSLGTFTNDPPSCTLTGTKLRFRWIDRSGTPAYVDASYALSGTQLTRTVCTTPVAGGSTTTSPGIALAKTVATAAATCTTGPTTGACNDGTLNGPASSQPKMPDSVHLAITATRNANTSGAAIVGTYSYTLSANLRPARADAPGPTNASPAALITLGSSCPAVSVKNGTTLRVYGDVLMNQNCVDFDPNSFYYRSITQSAGVADPFASLAPPTGLTTYTITTCNNTTLQPGRYTSPSGVSIGGTCTLAKGSYIFDHGIDLDNKTLKSAPGGVMLYFPNEGITSKSGAVLDIAAQTTGSYAGLAMWVAGSDLDFVNHVDVTVAGTLYAPNATFSFKNTANAPKITTLIVKTLSIKNGGNINLGPDHPNPPVLAVSAFTLPSPWTVGAQIAPIHITGSGGFGQYIFSINNGVPGLSIDQDTGIISGAPTQTGTRTLTVTLKDTFGDDPATASATMTINSALAITTASLPKGNPGAYSATLAKSGGTSPFTWSISAGTLPSGLSLNAATGVISGTSNTVAVSNFTVMLADSRGATKTKALSIKIGDLPTFTSITPNTFARNRLNQAVTINGTFFQNNLTLSFGAGITVNGPITVNGAKTQITTHIDIAPNAPLGAHDVTITNPDGGSVTSAGPLTINGVSITTNTCNVRKSTAMAGFTIGTTDGNAPYAWSPSGQPGWITLNPTTGVLTGTAPGTTGSVQFTVALTDGTGSSDSTTFTVVITNGNPGNPKC